MRVAVREFYVMHRICCPNMCCIVGCDGDGDIYITDEQKDALTNLDDKRSALPCGDGSYICTDCYCGVLSRLRKHIINGVCRSTMLNERLRTRELLQDTLSYIDLRTPSLETRFGTGRG